MYEIYILFKFTYLEKKSHFTYMKENACCSKIEIIILYIVERFFRSSGVLRNINSEAELI